MYKQNHHFRNRAIIYSIVLTLAIIQFSFAQTRDEALTQMIQSKISSYYADNINVSADNNGRVVLKGSVDVLFDKLNIFDIAAHVKGVKYIENNIIVNTQKLPDKIILANIDNSFQLMKSISEPDLVTFNIDNGLVFIKGKVRFARESVLLETMVSWQEGVVGIANQLEVEPVETALSDATLKNVIADLLKDEFPLEKYVSFTVKQGQVDLNGSVTRLWSKITIEKEIRRIVGVTSLKNNLQVKENGTPVNPS